MLPGWQAHSGAGAVCHLNCTHGMRESGLSLWNLRRRPSSIAFLASALQHPRPHCLLRFARTRRREWPSWPRGSCAPSALGQSSWRGANAWSTSALWERRRMSRGNRLVVHCKDDKNVRRGQPNRPWSPWSWLTQKASSIKAQLSARVIFNVLMLFLLMRLWPIGGRNPVGDPSHTWEVCPLCLLALQVLGGIPRLLVCCNQMLAALPWLFESLHSA